MGFDVTRLSPTALAEPCWCLWHPLAERCNPDDARARVGEVGVGSNPSKEPDIAPG